MSGSESNVMANQNKKKVSDFFDDINAAEKARAILKRFFVNDLLGPSLSLGRFSSGICRGDFSCVVSGENQKAL